MKNKIIKWGFRQNIFGKQILQVFVAVVHSEWCLHTNDERTWTTEEWRDATREEADMIICKINEN